MPTVLREYQHELIGADGATPLILFGTLDTGYMTTIHPSTESTDGVIGDVQRVREDGLSFGEDYLGSKTATFELAVLTDHAPDPQLAQSAALERLEGAWKNPAVRNRVGQFAILRSHMTPGSPRRAYGRPRRYADTPSETTKNGLSTVVCDFLVSDGTWYSEVEHVVSFKSSATTFEGGLVAPLVTPLTTTAANISGDASVKVAGSSPTWPVTTFYGPCLNPRIILGDTVIGLNASIDAGQSVTIDPRPWSRRVRRSDGANMAGKLTYDTPPLRLMQLDPGSYVGHYRSLDTFGTSRAELRFRDAYPRW